MERAVSAVGVGSARHSNAVLAQEGVKGARLLVARYFEVGDEVLQRVGQTSAEEMRQLLLRMADLMLISRVQAASKAWVSGQAPRILAHMGRVLKNA